MENFRATNVLPFIFSSETNSLLNMFMSNENSSRRNKSETQQKSNYIRCLEDHLKYQNNMYTYTYRGYTFSIYCPFRFNWIAEVKIPFNHVDYRVNAHELNHVYKVYNGIHRNYGSDSLIITTDSAQDYCLLRESFHNTNESKTIYRDFEFVKNQAMYLIDQMCERQNLYLAGRRRTQYTRNAQFSTPKNVTNQETLSIIDLISRLQGSENNYLDTFNKITNLKPGQSVCFDVKIDNGDLFSTSEEKFDQNKFWSSLVKNKEGKETMSCCEEDCAFCNDPYVSEFEKEKTREQNDLSDTNTDYLYNYFVNEDKLKEKYKNKKVENNFLDINSIFDYLLNTDNLNKKSTDKEPENNNKYMNMFTNYIMDSLNLPKPETEEISNTQHYINVIDDLLNRINQPNSTINVDSKNTQIDITSDSNKKDTTVVTKDGVTISDYDEQDDEDYNQYEFIPDTCSPTNCSVYNSESRTDNEEEQAMLSNSSEDNTDVSTDSDMPSLENVEYSQDYSDNSSCIDDGPWTRTDQEFNDANISSQ
ncbi:hypothetical protein [Saudi moumouvirus]|nr:hypothetical protein [Saudi moumouvirus]